MHKPCLEFRDQFSQCYGIQNTLQVQGQHKYDASTKIVQILHVRGNHWVVISNLLYHDNEIKYYDTIYNDINKHINNMFGEDITVIVDTQVQKQKGHKDCGVFCHFTLT